MTPRRSLALMLVLASQHLLLSAQNNPLPGLDARIDVGDRALHIVCAGTGSPTVILEAGLGSNARTWDKVLPEISRFTRVCSYDRPNLGQSDPAPRAVRQIASATYLELRSGQQLVRDLETLLERAKESRPYVLVGHSVGGLLAMLYASQHQNDIVGMVLIESVHPDQVARLQALMTPSEAKLDQESLTQNREGLDIDRILREVPSDWHTTIPLRVLAQGRPEANPTERSKQEAAVWRELQIDLSRKSENGKLIVADRSGMTSTSISRTWSSVQSRTSWI